MKAFSLCSVFPHESSGGRVFVYNAACSLNGGTNHTKHVYISCPYNLVECVMGKARSGVVPFHFSNLHRKNVL